MGYCCLQRSQAGEYSHSSLFARTSPPRLPYGKLKMKFAPITVVLASTFLAPVALAQLPFDLLEITDDKQAPEFPGIDFEFFCVGFEESEGAGCAVMDYDNDGLIDVYLPNTEFHASALYRNLGGGQFVDVAASLGVDEIFRRRAGGLFLDMENDGDLDLLTIGYPGYTADQNLFTLFRSNGAPAFTFTDVTVSAGSFTHAPTADPTLLGDHGGSTAGDYNNDGYIDFLVTYFARLPGYLYDQMRIYRNDPNAPAAPGQRDWSERQFIDSTISAGLDDWFPGGTWMPSFLDYNRDGFLDIHINVDYEFDILRLNDGAGGFGPNTSSQVGLNGSPALTRNEMGIAFGDIDFDGDIDQFNSNAYWGDRFYRNDSVFGAAGTGMAFVDFAPNVGADLARMGWGCALADMDNDRDLDLLRVAGLTLPQDNWFHLNLWPQTLADGLTPKYNDNGKQLLEFTKPKAQPGGDRDIGRALVPVDYDNDGDLDLIVTRPGTSPFIFPGDHVRTAVYENTLSTTDNWVEVDLRGQGGSRNVAHAKVYLSTDGVVQVKQVLVGTSFAAQEPDRMHFGIGGSSSVDWILVRWHDGTITGQSSLPINQISTINYSALDLLGDVNLNGVVNGIDVIAVRWLLENPVIAEAQYGHLPFKILGDMNDDNVFDSLDHAILSNLVP
jgi:hypothetical protein